MLSTLAFSLIGTLVFALIALGLIRLLAAMGDGQRLQTPGGRTSDETRRRPSSRSR